MGCNIFGGVMSSYLLSKVGLTSYYMIMMLFGVVAVFLFSIMGKPKQNQDEIR